MPNLDDLALSMSDFKELNTLDVMQLLDTVLEGNVAEALQFQPNGGETLGHLIAMRPERELHQRYLNMIAGLNNPSEFLALRDAEDRSVLDRFILVNAHHTLLDIQSFALANESQNQQISEAISTPSAPYIGSSSNMHYSLENAEITSEQIDNWSESLNSKNEMPKPKQDESLNNDEPLIYFPESSDKKREKEEDIYAPSEALYPSLQEEAASSSSAPQLAESSQSPAEKLQHDVLEFLCFQGKHLETFDKQGRRGLKSFYQEIYQRLNNESIDEQGLIAELSNKNKNGYTLGRDFLSYFISDEQALFSYLNLLKTLAYLGDTDAIFTILSDSAGIRGVNQAYLFATADSPAVVHAFVQWLVDMKPVIDSEKFSKFMKMAYTKDSTPASLAVVLFNNNRHESLLLLIVNNLISEQDFRFLVKNKKFVLATIAAQSPERQVELLRPVVEMHPDSVLYRIFTTSNGIGKPQIHKGVLGELSRQYTTASAAVERNNSLIPDGENLNQFKIALKHLLTFQQQHSNSAPQSVTGILKVHYQILEKIAQANAISATDLEDVIMSLENKACTFGVSFLSNKNEKAGVAYFNMVIALTKLNADLGYRLLCQKSSTHGHIGHNFTKLATSELYNKQFFDFLVEMKTLLGTEKFDTFLDAQHHFDNKKTTMLEMLRSDLVVEMAKRGLISKKQQSLGIVSNTKAFTLSPAIADALNAVAQGKYAAVVADIGTFAKTVYAELKKAENPQSMLHTLTRQAHPSLLTFGHFVSRGGNSTQAIAYCNLLQALHAQGLASLDLAYHLLQLSEKDESIITNILNYQDEKVLVSYANLIVCLAQAEDDLIKKAAMRLLSSRANNEESANKGEDVVTRLIALKEYNILTKLMQAGCLSDSHQQQVEQEFERLCGTMFLNKGKKASEEASSSSYSSTPGLLFSHTAQQDKEEPSEEALDNFGLDLLS